MLVRNALVVVALFATVAAAEPHIVIVKTSDAPPLTALAAQVQMHANRAIRISTIEDSATSTAFAARASQVVVQHDATLVVWVGGGGDTLLVFAAGRWPDRALIELVRIDASTAPAEVERVVALKVTSLLDTATSPRPIAVSLGVPVIRARTEAFWRLGVTTSLVRESGERAWDARLELAFERAWSRGAWSYAAGLGAYYQPTTTIDSVSLYEVGAAAIASLERTWSAWTVFARAQAMASLLAADGVNRAGVRGSVDAFSPLVGVDLGARWDVSDNLVLVLDAGFEYALIDQRFLVDGDVIIGLGHIRGRVGFGVSVPLR